MLEAARDFATVLPRAARWRKAASEKSLAQRTWLYTSGDELAGGDHRGMTDDGDVFTLAARLHAQNAANARSGARLWREFLFLLGLITGFVEQKFNSPRMGLAAHLD
jgi:hypothetical protein